MPIACTCTLAGTLAIACTALKTLAIALTGLCPTRSTLAAEALRRCAVAISDVAAMRPIVIPATARDAGAVEGVVPAGVDIDPSGCPVRATPDRRADRDGRAKAEGAVGECSGNPARRLVIVWRIVRIRPCAVHHTRIIDRHVSRLRIGALDHIAFDRLAARVRHRDLRHVHLR